MIHTHKKLIVFYINNKDQSCTCDQFEEDTISELSDLETETNYCV